MFAPPSPVGSCYVMGERELVAGRPNWGGEKMRKVFGKNPKNVHDGLDGTEIPEILV